jgi:hypothetical protein
MIFEKE